MFIHEYQAKMLLREEGQPVPVGEVAHSNDEAQAIFEKINKKSVVKAQVHAGGRGKAGGVKLVNTKEEAYDAAKNIIGMKIKNLTVEKVLVEEAVNIEKELYLGITLARDKNRNCLIFSPMGGMDIEEVAEKEPSQIFRIYIDPLIGLLDFELRTILFESGICKGERGPEIFKQFIVIARKLYEIYLKYDATLAEINPLVITKEGNLLIADAKMNLDDNALYRQSKIAKLQEVAEEDAIESEAHRRKIAYVRLDGNIGIVGNGAGLVMTTLDMVARSGGKAANFLDIGGGARSEVVKSSLELILMDPKIKGILFNIFGGITRCDEVAKGIIEALKDMDIKLPVVIRLAGTNEGEGKEILKSANLIPCSTMKDAAEKIVELTR